MPANPVIYTVLIKTEIERDENITMSEFQQIVEEVRDRAERLLPLQIKERVLETQLARVKEEISRD